MIDTLQSLNFCSSSRAAFQLVMRNLLRVVVLDRLESLKLILISQKILGTKKHNDCRNFFPNILLSVTDVLLLLGKLVVVLLCGATSYLAFHGHIPEVDNHFRHCDVT